MIQILRKLKDGGPKSPVDAYFLFEIKSICSVALLKFNAGRREEFHTHAFNAFTWFLSGDLVEEDVSGETYRYTKSLIPKLTRKTKSHRVKATTDSWCFTVRGPWTDRWTEYNRETQTTTTLTHGRIEVHDN